MLPTRLPFALRRLPAVAASFRGFSTWEDSFLKAIKPVDGAMSHADSADLMRSVVSSKLLSNTDLRDNPRRFFKAHRMLADAVCVEHGPGFWIRFTVHYNLGCGTVLAVGGEDQIESLATSQDNGELWSFSLTEALAGVQSGLLVQTTATYDADAREFVINTPAPGAAKRWISQGFTADKTIVVADVTVGGEPVGPHAFVVALRSNGDLLPGIAVEDMGVKTTGNDLDNALISFDNHRVPRTALLDAHAYVGDDGEYVRRTEMHPFAMIGQRLYSGRVAVAQAALAYTRSLFRRTKAYTDGKPIWSSLAAKAGGELPMLSTVPQLRSLYAEADDDLAALEAFVGKCEDALVPLVEAGKAPDADVAHAIATAKVKAVEKALDLCWRLKKEVGSYALMKSAGFGDLDFLSCCQFAEGDSRILMLKMARDRMAAASKSGGECPPGHEAEMELCKQLGGAMAKAGGDKAQQAKIWDDEWRTVYNLAEAVMARTLKEF